MLFIYRLIPNASFFEGRLKSSPPVADSDDENAEGWHDEVVTEGVDKYPKSDYNIFRMKKSDFGHFEVNR